MIKTSLFSALIPAKFDLNRPCRSKVMGDSVSLYLRVYISGMPVGLWDITREMRPPVASFSLYIYFLSCLPFGERSPSYAKPSLCSYRTALPYAPETGEGVDGRTVERCTPWVPRLTLLLTLIEYV